MATKEAANGAAQSEVEVKQAAKIDITKPVIIKPVNVYLEDDKADDYYQLRLTNQALQLIEEHVGINLWQGLGAIENIKPRHLAQIVWACLLWKHKDLKIEDVEIMPGMDLPNLLYIVGRIDAAIYAHMPEPEPLKEGEEPADPNASPSAGSNSGQSAE